jgi:beta-galactosidase
VIHAARPDAPLMNGESASCQSSRGDWGSGQGALACTAASWTPAAERSWVAGQFVWSLFDYGGESAWPAVYSYYGVMDICGFPKPVASWYYTWWAAANRPGGNASVLAFPDWSFPASEIGSRVTITALSPAVGGSLVLTVNGKPVGQPQPIQQFGFAVWTDVPYQPGSYTVQAVAANGTVLGEHTSASCGAASALRASLEWPGSGPDGALLADGVDAALVRVAVVDATGCTVPYAANNLSFAVSANGQLLGLGNGDSTDHQPRSGATTRPAYAGLAMAVLRAVPDTVQPIVLTIAAVDGSLTPAVISVPTSPVLAAAL